MQISRVFSDPEAKIPNEKMKRSNVNFPALPNLRLSSNPNIRPAAC